ncbi:MAG: ATP-binding protein [Pseudomonadales bacterium]|nr:ATP-binding protein [Pseudomonadales bacterium]
MPEQTSSLDYSLQTRLLVAISILLGIFLSLTGLVLDSAFRNSLQTRVAEQLQVQIYVLLAAVDEEEGSFYFVEDLREPRLVQINSGLYGFISNAAGEVLLRSPSAIEQDPGQFAFQRETLARGQSDFGRINAASGEEYFLARYGVIWESQQQNYTFTILESTSTYALEVADFRTSLWSWLGGLALLLLVLQLLLLHWGLEPLRRLAGDLKLIENGEANCLNNAYPRELKTVTDNLNLLIQSERKQQDRYRTTLADLAHSLKTPLAIIRGQLADTSTHEPDTTQVEAGSLHIIDEQVRQMNQIINYQLQRAVKANDGNVLARRANIARLTKQVLTALQKVYADKHIKVDYQLDAAVDFLGDERDMLEILGNVLDNAFKYGRDQVWVSGKLDTENGSVFLLQIEDNGVGIPEKLREYVLQRGARVDSLVQGQGIGLAVVTDILGSYGGQINIGESRHGGACVQLRFVNVQLREQEAP